MGKTFVHKRFPLYNNGNMLFLSGTILNLLQSIVAVKSKLNLLQSILVVKSNGFPRKLKNSQLGQQVLTEI